MNNGNIAMKSQFGDKLRISLIISTYNWPGALALCLKSVEQQKLLPFEVIVADDGSDESTRNLINSFKRSYPIPITHVWQPDHGFQLAKIRNKAIAEASGEYIIQIDGDLILNTHFIQDHRDFSRKGIFVTGSRVMLSEKLSRKLIGQSSINIPYFDFGVSSRINGVRCRLLRNYMADRYRINDIYFMRGCNMAFWREDLIKVNGYNEEFVGWGREDNDIAIRMINLGLKKRVIKFGAVTYHLYHPHNSRANLDINDLLLQEALAGKKIDCLIGLNQYM